MQSAQSMTAKVESLRRYAREGSVIRHYLEPSIKAPKLFHAQVPEGVENSECKTGLISCQFDVTTYRMIFSHGVSQSILKHGQNAY